MCKNSNRLSHLSFGGFNRIVCSDLGVVHIRLARLGTPRDHVRPVLPALHVADDPQWATRLRERRTDRVPGLLTDAGGFIHHRGIDVLTVEVVRLLGALEPDRRGLGLAVDPFVGNEFSDIQAGRTGYCAARTPRQKFERHRRVLPLSGFDHE